MYNIYKIVNLNFMEFHQPSWTQIFENYMRHLQISIHFSEKKRNMVSYGYMEPFPDIRWKKKFMKKLRGGGED